MYKIIETLFCWQIFGVTLFSPKKTKFLFDIFEGDFHINLFFDPKRKTYLISLMESRQVGAHQSFVIFFQFINIIWASNKIVPFLHFFCFWKKNTPFSCLVFIFLGHLSISYYLEWNFRSCFALGIWNLTTLTLLPNIVILTSPKHDF